VSSAPSGREPRGSGPGGAGGPAAAAPATVGSREQQPAPPAAGAGPER
jgi:hypothetical protein